jgi:hypothetical protein
MLGTCSHQATSRKVRVCAYRVQWILRAFTVTLVPTSMTTSSRSVSDASAMSQSQSSKKMFKFHAIKDSTAEGKRLLDMLVSIFFCMFFKLQAYEADHAFSRRLPKRSRRHTCVGAPLASSWCVALSGSCTRPKAYHSLPGREGSEQVSYHAYMHRYGALLMLLPQHARDICLRL